MWLRSKLEHLPLGGIRYFEKIPSTMDEAAAWLKDDAPDMALVIANEQTQGRGRLNRTWYTPANAALAFSLILRPKPHEPISSWMLYSGLAAVSICEVLEGHFQLLPQIKWPNDILLNHKKTAGILLESQWQGNELMGMIIGVGINVAPSSIPPLSAVLFPATCMEECLAESYLAGVQSIDRYQTLAWILEHILVWREQISSPPFIQSWEARLAYRNQWVQIFQEPSNQTNPIPVFEGILMGLNDDGSLRIQNSQSKIQDIRSGEIRLRVK